MKKVIAVIIFSFIINLAFSESIDSLKVKREILYSQYSSINSPGKVLNKTECEKVVAILKDLVIVDTKMIKEFSKFNKKEKEYNSKINSLNEENNSLSKELTSSLNYIKIINIAGGIVVIFLIISLIFLFIFFVKYKKIKRG